jgi:hypothetical protein
MQAHRKARALRALAFVECGEGLIGHKAGKGLIGRIHSVAVLLALALVEAPVGAAEVGVRVQGKPPGLAPLARIAVGNKNVLFVDSCGVWNIQGGRLGERGWCAQGEAGIGQACGGRKGYDPRAVAVQGGAGAERGRSLLACNPASTKMCARCTKSRCPGLEVCQAGVG